jgi:hypothetical protein
MLSLQHKVIIGGAIGLFLTRGLFMYGLLNKQQLFNIIDDVVETVGGGENAKDLLIETANIESKFGTIPYNPYRGYGLGVMQFDKVGFYDTQARTSERLKQVIKQRYGVEIDKLQYEDLRFSPLISVIMARLKYYLVPSKIPDTIQARADYWYKWYNGGGAGTPEQGRTKYLTINKA